MIHFSLLFWLALAIPGYAALCHFDREQLKSGLLGTLGLSYLATFGLLSPISILCYLLHLPVAIFGGFCVVLVATGVVEIIRQGWWREVWKLAVGAVGVELVLLLFDLVLGARVGATFAGDARLHAARIRQLLDHGFTNDDPFVSGGHFFSIYHTNLVYALYAACSWITRIDYLGVWHASLPFSKLLITSGCYYLAWCVFERRWAAWIAALFFISTQVPVTYLVYPNKIAPYWLMPIIIAFGIQACRSPCGWRSVIKLGLAAVVIGHIHGLYGVFVLVLLGPLLGGVTLFKFIRRRSDRWWMLVCLAALSFSLPFPVISKITTQVDKSANEQVSSSNEYDQMFVKTGMGLTMRDPRQGFAGTKGVRKALLIVGVIVALYTRRRSQAACLLAVVLSCAVLLFFPPICTAFLALVKSKWILLRIGVIFRIAFVVLVPALIAYLAETKTRFWWIRGLISVVTCLAAVFMVEPGAPFKAWREHLEIALKPASERRAVLTFYRGLRGALQDHIPPGETVLTNDMMGPILVLLHDCYIVIPDRGSMGVPGRTQRRRDLARMLDNDVDWEERRQLLQDYGIRYFVPTEPAEWPIGHIKAYWTWDQLLIVELAVD